MTDLQYPIVVRALPEEEGGGFIAYAPDLNGCCGDGATQEEAVTDLRNAIEEWRSEAERLNRQIPHPESSIKRALKERHDLAKLIKAQGELVELQKKMLQSQKAAVKAAQEEVDQIKRRLESISSQADDEAHGFGWRGAPMPAIIMAHRGKHPKDGDFSH
jgi:predicted RNase H-like HicB family nuclease